MTQAIPCALILNELISNIYKHAFVGRERGSFEISGNILTDETVSIRVRDDGIGIPEAFDLNTASNLGLNLSHEMVKYQFKGIIQIKQDHGTHIQIALKKLT